MASSPEPVRVLSRAEFLVELDAHGSGAIVVLGLEHLTYINAALTFSKGDEVLQRAAAVLADAMGPHALVARVADAKLAAGRVDGDTMAAHAAASMALTRLREEVAHWAGAGAGVAGWQDRERPAAALAAAMLAAHEAERDGAAPVRYADTGADGPLVRVARLRAALDADELVLHAQPIVDLRSGQTARHELLVRMRDGQGGLIAPTWFLPAAERFGLIGDVDLWVARRGLALAAAGHGISINLSAHSLGDRRLLQTIDEALRAHPPRVPLMVEVSESAVAHRQDWAGLTFLQRLSRMGCVVALDNFGAGGSSLAALRDLPVEVLKLESAFGSDLRAGTRERHVLDAIVTLAGHLGIQTVAGGIEDEGVIPALREAGVDYVQGHASGAPLDAAVAGLAA